MKIKKYIYCYTYDNTESELCKLESKYLFNEEEKNRLLFSDIKIEPSSSAFIKKRLQIISSSDNYSTLITKIKNEILINDGFKVEYLVFDDDPTRYNDRLEKLKDIGFCIDGYPDYYNPTTTYALCQFEGIWCFGILIKDDLDWYKHKQKPRSYSNSININIAKTLVNLASIGNTKNKLLDACCGVGTIMLEACFAGYNIDGCDISWKVSRNARENISHYNYIATVHHSDIKDLNKKYDAAIIDLPYNLVSYATDKDILHIMESVSQITDRMVIVSTSDISGFINEIGFVTSDYCSVSKRGNRDFARKIWVCNKNG